MPEADARYVGGGREKRRACVWPLATPSCSRRQELVAPGISTRYDSYSCPGSVSRVSTGMVRIRMGWKSSEKSPPIYSEDIFTSRFSPTPLPLAPLPQIPVFQVRKLKNTTWKHTFFYSTLLYSLEDSFSLRYWFFPCPLSVVICSFVCLFWIFQ